MFDSFSPDQLFTLKLNIMKKISTSDLQANIFFAAVILAFAVACVVAVINCNVINL